MIGFIIKNFRIIIDSLIIAALIIAFSFWDPFGWFKRQTNIRNTPVSLRSVKEIGQLVTAEYYGEVVASLKESMIEEYADTTLQREVNTLFSNVLASVLILKEENNENKSKWINLKGSIKAGNIARKYADRFNIYTENYLYYPLITFLADTLSKSKDLSAGGEAENQTLWYLFTADQTEWDKFNAITEKKPGYLKHFKNHYHDYRVDSVRSEKIKKEIIYIGRGWVKAGIDFQDFNEAKFWYDEQTRIVYFRNFEPKILDCDINPWYIPERQIKGFELVVATGKIKEPFEDSRKVKILCKEKLRKQALQSGILEQARENARLSIQNLFSLLMDEPVKDVIFSSGKYGLLMQEIIADSVINETESLLLSTLIRKDAHVLDTAWYTHLKIQINDLKDFCKILKNYKFELTGQSFDFFSPLISEIYQDGILKDEDIVTLSNKNALIVKGMDRFEVKSKIFQLYCQLSPDFNTVFRFLRDDSLARIYLQLSPELFSIQNKTQYFLSSQVKKDFVQTFEDKMNTVLPKDPDFEALFWYDSHENYLRAVTRFNLQIFDLATNSMVTPDSLILILPDQDHLFVNQLKTTLNRRFIKISFQNN